MSEDPEVPDDLPEEWRAMFEQIFGERADEALAAMRDAGINPNALTSSAAGLSPDQVRRGIEQINEFLSRPGTGVDWTVTHDVARHVAVQSTDPSVSELERQSVTGALDVAELWLDPVMDFPQTPAMQVAWSRSEWVEATFPAWQKIAEPVAESVAEALAAALTAQLPDGLAEEEAEGELPAMVASMLRRVGGTAFAMQVGQAVGTLAGEVFGSTDTALPLVDRPVTALLPANVAAFGADLEIPAEEVRIYLAVREAAHNRLFTHVPWLRSYLFGEVEAYAREITIDMERLEESVRSIDPTDAEAIQRALSGGVFSVTASPAQQVVLARLETALALVEGWVDHVTGQAARLLPDADALREMIRRRRAVGGPAEHTFATLVGLELRPRRSRDAVALWQAIEKERGVSGRDAIWAHPDLLPTADDLDNPEDFGTKAQLAAMMDADIDAAIAELLGADPRAAGHDPRPAGDTEADASGGDSPEAADRGKDSPDAASPGDMGPDKDGPGDPPQTEHRS